MIRRITNCGSETHSPNFPNKPTRLGSSNQCAATVTKTTLNIQKTAMTATTPSRSPRGIFIGRIIQMVDANDPKSSRRSVAVKLFHRGERHEMISPFGPTSPNQRGFEFARIGAKIAPSATSPIHPIAIIAERFRKTRDHASAQNPRASLVPRPRIASTPEIAEGSLCIGHPRICDGIQNVSEEKRGKRDATNHDRIGQHDFRVMQANRFQHQRSHARN